jgi:hypothetical protein
MHTGKEGPTKGLADSHQRDHLTASDRIPVRFDSRLEHRDKLPGCPTHEQKEADREPHCEADAQYAAIGRVDEAILGSILVRSCRQLTRGGHHQQK